MAGYSSQLVYRSTVVERERDDDVSVELMMARKDSGLVMKED